MVAVNSPASLIGEHGQRDLLAFGEAFEGSGGIVADANDLAAGVRKLLDPALELLQLEFAEEAPVGGTVEHDGDGAFFDEGIEGDNVIVLVFEGEGGGLLADSQANFGRRRVVPRR